MATLSDQLYSSSSSDGEGSRELERRTQDVEAGEYDDEDLDQVVREGDEEDGYGVVSKYAKVNQPCPFSKQAPKNRYSLEWRNINYKVVFPVPPESIFLRLLLKLPIPDMIANLFKTKKEVPILNNVSGRVPAGQLLAIMGPTGSGKTTLLNVLARRIKHNVDGDILVNGEPVQGRRLKRRMAYVLQEDIFFPHITVRDTVATTANLKLPPSLSKEEKTQRVEDILTELGIQRCSNTIVGGGWVRGVSGGERKRTNIANELVNNPALIFLDEPTSGLDAATSLGLIVTLKNLAKSGHTVVTTIHQPSSAMFMMFDNVLLLAEGGWAVYAGPASGILSYFTSLGLQSPPNYNPADLALEVVTSNEKVADGRTVRQMLIDTYAENEPKQREVLKPLQFDDADREAVHDMRKGSKYPTSFLLQTYLITVRAFKQMRHDILSWTALLQMTALGLLAGILWFRMDKDESSIGDRTGFLFYSTMFWILHPWFLSLFAFPAERAVLNKERATGNYRLSAYYLGKTFAEVPLWMALGLLFSCISYWMVGMSSYSGNFFFFLFIMSLFVVLGTSFGAFIGAVIPDVKKALSLSVVLMLGSVLLGGFFIQRSNLPVWVAWARWISYMKYSYELLLINEFAMSHNQFFTPAPEHSTYDTAEGGLITGGQILDHYGVETNWWGDIIFIVGLIIVCRVLGYLALRFLNKPRV